MVSIRSFRVAFKAPLDGTQRLPIHRLEVEIRTFSQEDRTLTPETRKMDFPLECGCAVRRSATVVLVPSLCFHVCFSSCLVTCCTSFLIWKHVHYFSLILLDCLL